LKDLPYLKTVRREQLVDHQDTNKGKRTAKGEKKALIRKETERDPPGRALWGNNGAPNHENKKNKELTKENPCAQGHQGGVTKDRKGPATSAQKPRPGSSSLKVARPVKGNWTRRGPTGGGGNEQG